MNRVEIGVRVEFHRSSPSDELSNSSHEFARP